MNSLLVVGIIIGVLVLGVIVWSCFAIEGIDDDEAEKMGVRRS